MAGLVILIFYHFIVQNHSPNYLISVEAFCYNVYNFQCLVFMIELAVFLVIFPVIEVKLAGVLVSLGVSKNVWFYNVVDELVYWFALFTSIVFVYFTTVVFSFWPYFASELLYWYKYGLC